MIHMVMKLVTVQLHKLMNILIKKIITIGQVTNRIIVIIDTIMINKTKINIRISKMNFKNKICINNSFIVIKIKL